MPDQALEKELTAALAQAEDLPSLPTVAVEVLRLSQDEDATLDELAKVIQSDPALAARLLKLANSSLFNAGQEVTTLQRATMVLGMKTVKLMSLSFCLASTLPTSGKGAFDFQAFWRRSLVAAVAGRAFARLVGNKSGDEAFLCGLLSRLGQLVASQCMSDLYAGVLDRAAGRWPTIALEQKVLGFHSGHVVATLLDEWSLPETIALPVAYMDRPQELPSNVGPEVRKLTFLMAMTALMVNILCDEEKGKEFRKLYELGKDRFQLSEAEIDAFLIGLEGGIRETAKMLDVKLDDDLAHQEIVENAREQMVLISLGAARDETPRGEAYTDELTGLRNRAAFEEALTAEIAARIAGERQRALGVVLVEVDGFKAIHDTRGPKAGEAVLAKVGDVVSRLTRKGDLAVRYGEKEFALMLPATTPSHLKTVTDRIRRAIEAAAAVFEDKELRVTASFGGACLKTAREPGDGASLTRAAESCLSKAKEDGRNRCEVSSQSELPGR